MDMNPIKIDSEIKEIMKPIVKIAEKIERAYILPIKLFDKKFNQVLKTEEERIKIAKNGCN